MNIFPREFDVKERIRIHFNYPMDNFYVVAIDFHGELFVEENQLFQQKLFQIFGIAFRLFS